MWYNKALTASEDFAVSDEHLRELIRKSLTTPPTPEQLKMREDYNREVQKSTEAHALQLDYIKRKYEWDLRKQLALYANTPPSGSEATRDE